jgi:ADP-ribose pyrophosphatase YjhB (NUDIX family)
MTKPSTYLDSRSGKNPRPHRNRSTNHLDYPMLSREPMATERKFAHFKKQIVPPRINEIPEGGFCISAFVIISKKRNKDRVLMGRINKTARWDHIGGLDPERVERHSKGWMLPSSGLVWGESPQDAAERILKEQLGLMDQKLDGPLVFSELYGQPNHWDLEFLFLGKRNNLPSNGAWSELKFIDLKKTRKEEIARLHEDILAHVCKWK